MVIFTTILIISEIIFFIGFLFFLKRRFEKKFLTAQIKHELEELVTSFNRQAEINILTIDNRLEQARTLIATLEKSQKTLPTDRNKTPEALLVKSTASPSQKRSIKSDQCSTENSSTAPLEKQSRLAKKTTTAHDAISPLIKATVSNATVSKRTKGISLRSPKPEKKITEQKITEQSRGSKKSPAQQHTIQSTPSTKQNLTPSLSPKRSGSQKSKILSSIQKEPTLNQQILKLAEANHSLTMIAYKLDIPLNEVRLRLELQRSNIQHLKHSLQKRLSN
ncbi:hypothetical protein COTS27_00785 [Spirochaetota bacterium]|nr:hypothetical protein COTS27_00785 [Spirochaetota bacterium]